MNRQELIAHIRLLSSNFTKSDIFDILYDSLDKEQLGDIFKQILTTRVFRNSEIIELTKEEYDRLVEPWKVSDVCEAESEPEKEEPVEEVKEEPKDIRQRIIEGEASDRERFEFLSDLSEVDVEEFTRPNMIERAAEVERLASKYKGINLSERLNDPRLTKEDFKQIDSVLRKVGITDNNYWD